MAGQNSGWHGSSLQISSWDAFEGQKVLNVIGDYLWATYAEKSGALLNDGMITVYVKKVIGGTTDPSIEINLKEGSKIVSAVEIHNSFRYFDGEKDSYVIFYPSVNNWNAVQIQWRSSDHKFRYRINKEAWSEWATGVDNWTAGIDTLRFESQNGVAKFDAIRENLIVEHPVLIVPGVMGTEMFNGVEKLWPDSTRMLLSITDNFMDSLGFNENLYPANQGVFPQQVLRREAIFDYTEGLINEFKDQGYVEGESLFTFPYDWRYGVSGKYPSTGSGQATNSDLLAEKIQEILNQTGAAEVDIVAHSMGGLVVKKYAIDAASRGEDKIGKAVFAGVPNTGAPKAVKVLLQGDNFGVLGLNDQEMKKISQNLPASYDLLPSQKYYDVKGSFIRTIEEAGQTENIVKDLNFEETKNFLTADHSLNSAGLEGAVALHGQSFDDFDLRTAGVDLYSIVGCMAGTIGRITERKVSAFLGNFTYYSNSKFAPGDNTVPLESATNLPLDAEKKFYALQADHGKMPSQNGIRQKIVNIISGSSLAVPANLITQDIAQCQLNGQAISVFSPINIFATDQSGNKIGLAEDSSLINEIPNAGFEIWGQEKFVYLPAGQDYNVGFAGAGEGSYTIKVDQITNGAIESAEVFSNLTATPQLSGQINLSETGTTLAVNSQIIAPNAVLTAEEAQSFTPPIDQTPPEAIIEFDPIKKDLKFSSAEPGAMVQDNGNKIILTDSSGNATEITLKERDRKILMRAEIASIKYNGVLAGISRNFFKFSWRYNKKKNLETFTQRAISRKDYNILAAYNGKTTKITGREFPGRINQTFDGLKIIKVTTNKGDFDWSY